MARKRTDSRIIAKSSAIPTDYPAMLADIKARIRTAQIKAALSVNRELIQLYWDIGRAIVGKQCGAATRDAEGWGKSVVERLARDLQNAFPGLEGFSARNIWHARSFFLAYANVTRGLKQAVSESDRSAAPRSDETAAAILPQAVSEIPWGHNIILLQKLKDSARRLWYAQQAVLNGWSRSMLVQWIESDLYARQGKAITNFKAALPSPQSDLAQQVLKDPYNFDFLTLHAEAMERELEEGLTEHITRFLLELGAGFAFVGRQVHLAVDNPPAQSPYDQLSHSYSRILQYIKEKGYTVTLPTREGYLKGPGMIFKGNPQELPDRNPDAHCLNQHDEGRPSW